MRRKPLAVGILIVCSSLAGLVETSFARPTAKKFDLKVQRIDHQEYLVHPEVLRLDYTVQNLGTERVAPVKVKIKVVKVGGGQPYYNEQTTFPGLNEAGSRFDRTDDRVSVTMPLGRYRAQVCAKFRKDKKKGNNCKTGPNFSVVPSAWTGVASFTTGLGSGGVEEYAETAPTATFFFDQHTREGFQYFGTGRVRYGTSGTDIAGCSHTGSATHDVTSDAVLVLSEDLLSYRADGLRPQSHTFPGFTDCPPPMFDGPYTGPLLIPAWIQTNKQPKADDATTISGVYAPQIGFFGLQWGWNFTAQ